MGGLNQLTGGLDVQGSLTSIGGGLVAVASGEDLDEVAGLVAKDVLLNLLPLFSLGTVVVIAAGAIKELFGIEKRPPVLGALLAGQSGNSREAMRLVMNAAIQRAAGFKRFRGPGPTAVALKEIGPHGIGALIAYSPHKDVPAAWWRWVVELDERLIDAARDGGEAGLIEELQTRASTLQAFHAAQELYDWALATRGKPTAKTYAWAPHGELLVLLGLLPFRAPYFLGAELPQLGGKHQLFKRLGVPSFAQYQAHVQGKAPPAPSETPQGAAPTPAKASTPGALQSAVSALGAALGSLSGNAPQVAAGAFADPTQGHVSSSEVGVPAKSSAIAQVGEGVVPLEREGSGALLLALAGLALVAALVLAAK